MTLPAIGLMFIIQGINIIWPIIPAFWLGVIYIVIGAYVLYKSKGEIRL